MNFENFYLNQNNQYAVQVARDYVDKNKENIQTNGLIITGMSGVGKTHLAAAIANRLIENENIVLMGRLTTLLDMIKETFSDNTRGMKVLKEFY